jgi:GNAT superfamily N-acetyltransferase
VTATDLPALAKLWYEKLVMQTERRISPAPDARESWAAAAQTWLNDPRCGLFAAERDDDLIGYIAGWTQPMPGLVPERIGLITEIAIDAHRYHGGVGRALFEALRAWFKTQGIEQIAIWTPCYDAVAQAFWRSLGAAEWVDVLWIRSS